MSGRFGGRHTFDFCKDDDDNNNANNNRALRGLPQVRTYHSSASNDRAVAIMLGLGTIAAVSYSAAQGVKAYNEWKASWPDEEPVQGDDDAKKTTTKAQDQTQENAETKKEKPKQEGKQKRENIFKEWFGVGVGAKYYEGGFEETMTRREAALILGKFVTWVHIAGEFETFSWHSCANGLTLLCFLCRRARIQFTCADQGSSS